MVIKTEITEDEAKLLVSKFGHRIAIARKERGATQEQLAKAIGASRYTICRWESGNRSPDIRNQVALCRALQVPPSYLFDDAFPVAEQ